MGEDASRERLRRQVLVFGQEHYPEVEQHVPGTRAALFGYTNQSAQAYAIALYARRPTFNESIIGPVYLNGAGIVNSLSGYLDLYRLNDCDVVLVMPSENLDLKAQVKGDADNLRDHGVKKVVYVTVLDAVVTPTEVHQPPEASVP